jgi:histone acetyltransferase 1
MIKRIQILVPLFIEGGTLVELDEPDWALERWTVFFLYEKAKLIIAVSIGIA